MADDAHAKSLIEKITALPPDRIAEVEAIVDRMAGDNRDNALRQAAARVSSAAFAAVWDNPEDSVYDDL
jgi:hypothetical protein